MASRRSAVRRLGFLISLCTLLVAFSGCEDIEGTKGNGGDGSASNGQSLASHKKSRGSKKAPGAPEEGSLSHAEQGAGATSGVVNGGRPSVGVGNSAGQDSRTKRHGREKNARKGGKGRRSHEEKGGLKAGAGLDTSAADRAKDARNAGAAKLLAEAGEGASKASRPRAGDKETSSGEETTSSEQSDDGKNARRKSSGRGTGAPRTAGGTAASGPSRDGASREASEKHPAPADQQQVAPVRVNAKGSKPFTEQKAKKMVLVVDWYTKTIAATMNGRRPQDEDAMVVHAPLKNFPDARLKAIFDGHGGYQVSRRCVNVASSYLGSMPNLSEESFRETCLQMDADMRADNLKGGSTGLMITIEKVDDPTAPDGISFNVYAANVGDSRGLIVHQDGTYTIMSKDHKPTAEIERERIQRAGGFLLRRMGVWRALKDRDDLHPNEQKIVAVPDLNVFRALPGDIVLMGCDGIFERPEMNWQFVADLLSVEMEKTGGGLAEVAYRILETAFMLGSRDNVSIMITKLVKRPVKNTEVKRFDYSFTGERVVLRSEVLTHKPTDDKSGRYGTGKDMLVTLF
ncbi:putative protein phosphatase 2C [Neospora caninum Liverpool]|uniref:Protein phosphatase 2C, putative n=1 Tax=Neospora caninum (strain Liverpool) TaxID=572307 RepID=F0VRU2_NEOCL|nr:putative protein phosphatase 2C [Neospora caninum Liverpool]CBZ56440.1 putative protein phosphatase 2C [Neospora caninum Liverpool]CEL71199.1 TPA: protein phosphatase 2C, putative [Neospora caninum Liverpool]|eukprot:XP_003886465.1 putative protein phosphatase 2C [Neospora caninum Liverpool]